MAQLTKDYENLVGDVLVSAGMIAYSGPFTPDFRQKLVKGWQEKLVELDIPHSDGCDVRLTLADPVQVRWFCGSTCNTGNSQCSYKCALVFSLCGRPCGMVGVVRGDAATT